MTSTPGHEPTRIRTRLELLTRHRAVVPGVVAIFAFVVSVIAMLAASSDSSANGFLRTSSRNFRNRLRPGSPSVSIVCSSPIAFEPLP